MQRFYVLASLVYILSAGAMWSQDPQTLPETSSQVTSTSDSAEKESVDADVAEGAEASTAEQPIEETVELAQTDGQGDTPPISNSAFADVSLPAT